MNETREVGVLVRRTKVDNPWIDHVWSPAGVLDDAPQTPPWTRLSSEQGEDLFYAGAGYIELHRSETGNYRDNLIDGDPQLWVGLKEAEGGAEVELVAVTADPTEGESLFESGLIVGKTPMPAAIAAWIAAYVDANHVERAFQKRKRDKSGPDPRKNPGARSGPPRGGAL
ncbi:MAG: DUF3305 domain-containing protein [Beijerinckiaceae bacterium]